MSTPKKGPYIDKPINQNHVITKLKAVVSSVIPKSGDKGGYVVTYPLEDQEIAPTVSITFSLENWASGTDPTQGQHVTLQRINQHARGLRAEYAEPVRI